MWLVMATAKVYFTGISLARARLASASAHARRVAWLPVGVLIAAIAVVGAAFARAYAANPPADFRAWLQLIGGVSMTGLSRFVLWPFIALARPLFADWPAPFFYALGESAIVLVAVAAWVLASDDAFQDAAAEVAAKRASGPAAAGGASFKARATGLTLAPVGRPELAFAWKAALQTFRLVDRRTLARFAAIAGALSVAAASIGRGNGVAAMFGAFAAVGVAFSVLMGPQALRIDMRQDLRHLELLKTWPIKASAIVRGELIWPGVLLTGSSWMLVALAAMLSAAVFTKVDLAMRLSAALAIAILAPALIFAQFTIHNGVALLFPAWVPLGNQRPRVSTRWGSGSSSSAAHGSC